MKCNCCIVHKIAGIILVLGGLNLGLVGAFQFDVIDAVLGQWPVVIRVVYVLVGLSALSMPFMMCCKKCKGDCYCGTK